MKYSNPFNRAIWILRHMVEEHIAIVGMQMAEPISTVQQWTKVLSCSRPTAKKSLELLVKWGHVTIILDENEVSHYVVTDEGFEWYQNHIEYCERIACIHDISIGGYGDAQTTYLQNI